MSNEQILEQFGANAGAYVASEVHAKGASLERLVALVKPKFNWGVLDVATGAGHTALTFAPLVAQVTATDITPEMLIQAELLADRHGSRNVVFEIADAEKLPYTDNSFDLLTCRIAAHHFPDIALFVTEAARTLRPGGFLAVVDNVVPPGPVGNYVNAFEKFRDPSHAQCWSQEEWVKSFAQAGFSLRHRETLAKRLDFQFWAQRHDQIMQSYLRALLLEAGLPATAFLQPRTDDGFLSFRLVEGILIGQKES